MNDLSPKDWNQDPEFKQIVLDAAFKNYESMKDNPYAAIGLANVLAALNGDYDKMRPIVTATPTLKERVVAWWHRLVG